MKISSTKCRVSEGELSFLATAPDGGLIENFFIKHFRINPPVMLSFKKFYYPYYCMAVDVIYKRFKMSDRVFHENVVFDCGFGFTTQMVGFPEASSVDVAADHVVKSAYTEAEAVSKVKKDLMKRYYKKIRSIPSAEVKNIFVMYKPYYACLCRKKEKKYYVIIDAETRERNYFLEYKQKRMMFEKEETERDSENE